MAKFCTLSIKEFRTLDIPFNKFYRKLFKMMPSFPRERIYASVSDNGLGMSKISDLIQFEKLAIIHRVSYSDGPGQQALDGILHRGLRNGQMHLLPGQCGPLRMIDELGIEPTWTTSIVELLRENDMNLSRGGVPMLGTMEENVIDYIYDGWDEGEISPRANGDIIKLVECNLRQVGDLHGNEEDEYRSPVQAIIDLKEKGACIYSGEHTWVRPGQFWTSEAESGCEKGEIVEILGTMGEEYVIRRWIQSNPINIRGAAVGDILNIEMNSCLLYTSDAADE